MNLNPGPALEVKIPIKKAELSGVLYRPEVPKGLIIFAHGSGSTHKSPRNIAVAEDLHKLGFATLLFDLLTLPEMEDRGNFFNVGLLCERLIEATEWAQKSKLLSELPIGYFGAGTGAAAALIAASLEKKIFAVVCRGGRPDLASKDLAKVECPVLLIVGSRDFDVITFNKKAKARLKRGEIVVIPGASHLFEETGALEEVVELSENWFSRTLAERKTEEFNGKDESALETINRIAHPFKSKKNLRPLLQRLSKSRIVMLGEATHGTEEFYSLRKVISKELIEDYGFNFIAVEGDWPDCFRLNRYINNEKSLDTVQDLMLNFKRWPQWLWANNQTSELIEWMKGRRVNFYGLDVYSLYESLESIKAYEEKLNVHMAERIFKNYACLDSFGHNEIAYAKSTIKWPDGCQQEILDSMREILRIRLDDTTLKKNELLDIQQNSKIIRNAEKYYRSMISGGPEAWNLRDEHMLDTLDSLLRHHGEGSKGIVWAHNTHVGDYHATDMLTEGYTNLGGLARERYGVGNVALLGFGTYQGKVLAGRSWGAKPEIMDVPPAPEGSYEELFHQAAKLQQSSQLYILMNGEASLCQKKGHRAIGVVFKNPGENDARNFVPTELARRYDAFAFFDTTTPLNTDFDFSQMKDEGTLPETWPLGL